MFKSTALEAPSDCDSVGRLLRLARRNFFQRINDSLFGYDFFISYRWSDGREYALTLVEKLRQRGYDCFLDTDEYLPWGNWITDGARAIQKTGYLLLICTPDAVMDPQGRPAADDPVVKELAAFAKSGRQKVRINVTPVEQHIWNASEIAKFFKPGDLYKDDFERVPSNSLIEELDSKFKLERVRIKRLRGIMAACVILLVLSICLLVALLFAVENYNEARTQQQSAINNLGDSYVKEAARLAGEARNWEAVDMLGKATGLLVRTDNVTSPYPGNALLDPHSSRFTQAKQLMMDHINYALRPAITPLALSAVPETAAIIVRGEDVVSFELGHDGTILKTSLLGSGVVTRLVFSVPAVYLNPVPHGEHWIVWADAANCVHLLDAFDDRDRMLGCLATPIAEIQQFWLDREATAVAYTKKSGKGGTLPLILADLKRGMEHRLRGTWSEESRGVFLKDGNLLMVGNAPFREANSSSNLWYAVLFNPEQRAPRSILPLDAEILSDASGGSYPKLTSLAAIDDAEAVAAIGLNDGSVRVITLRNPLDGLPGDLHPLSQLSARTLRGPAGYRFPITTLLSSRTHSRLIAGTEKGQLLIWSQSSGELLNVMKALEEPATVIREYDGYYLTADRKGTLNRWKDRAYLHRIDFNSEILHVVARGQDSVDVFTSNSQVHTFSYGPGGFRRTGERRQELDQFRKQVEQERLPERTWISRVKDYFNGKEIARALLFEHDQKVVIAFKSGELQLWKLNADALPQSKVWESRVSGAPEINVFLALAPDNSKLAVAGFAKGDDDKSMALLSMEDGKEFAHFAGDRIDIFGNDYPVVFIHNGKYLITGLYGCLYAWPTDIEDLLTSWRAAQARVEAKEKNWKVLTR